MSSEPLLTGLLCVKNMSFLSFKMFCKIVGHPDLVVPEGHRNSDPSRVITMRAGIIS